MAHGPGGWWITTLWKRDFHRDLVKVVTWGEAHCGGDSSQVQDQLKVGFWDVRRVLGWVDLPSKRGWTDTWDPPFTVEKIGKSSTQSLDLKRGYVSSPEGSIFQRNVIINKTVGGSSPICWGVEIGIRKEILNPKHRVGVEKSSPKNIFWNLWPHSPTLSLKPMFKLKRFEGSSFSIKKATVGRVGFMSLRMTGSYRFA